MKSTNKQNAHHGRWTTFKDFTGTELTGLYVRTMERVEALTSDEPTIVPGPDYFIVPLMRSAGEGGFFGLFLIGPGGAFPVYKVTSAKELEEWIATNVVDYKDIDPELRLFDLMIEFWYL